jgi:hypothetical protein
MGAAPSRITIIVAGGLLMSLGGGGAREPANPPQIPKENFEWSLNDILRSSRLVGLEVINGVAMNHFRATCPSEPRFW